MNLGLTDKQYKNLLSLLQEQAEPPASEPEAGTSSKQSGGQGYPQVGKWESGVTRGPGNQVGVTKWADVVGSKLNRGKANPLKEQLSTGVQSGTYNPTNQYTSSDGQTITPSPYFPKIQKQKQTKSVPKQSTLTNDEKEKLRKITDEITQDQYGNDYFTDGQPMTYPHYTNGGKTYLSDGGAIRWRNVDIKSYPPEFWKGKDKPKEPQKIDTDPKNGSIKPMVYDKLSGEYVVPYGTSNKTGYKRPGDKDNVWRHSAVNNKFYRTDLNNWYLGNLGVTLEHMENFENRKTDSGKSVPKGFDPNKYDEYLSKGVTIQKQIGDLESKHKMGYWSRKELNQLNNLKQQLVDLKNEYQNPNFSYGLDKKSQEHLNQLKKDLDSVFLTRIQDLRLQVKKDEDEYFKKYGSPKVQDATYNVKSSQPRRYTSPSQGLLTTLSTEYNDRLSKLYKSFGKDDWSKNIGMFGQDFDEWWDKWGTLVQVAGNILFVALSGGIVAVVRGGLAVAGEALALELSTNGMIKAVSPYVLDSIFNGSVAAYQISRKQDEEGLISLVCALVPFISFGANIGKVSVETANGLAIKIAKSDLENQTKLMSFINTLTDEEKHIFRDVYNLPRQSIKQGLDKIIENKSLKMAKIGFSVEKPAKKLWLKSLAKVTGFEMGLPLSTAIGNALFGVIKDKNITNFNLEELTDIRQTIKQYLETEPPEVVILAGNDIIKNISKIKSAQELKDNIKRWKGHEPSPDELSSIKDFISKNKPKD